MSRPQEAWEGYRLKVYETSKPLRQTQERECSMAFYAGMFEAFMTMVEITERPDEEAAAIDLGKFRQEIEVAAAKANLDRSTGLS